jgi:hypothetical protein
MYLGLKTSVLWDVTRCSLIESYKGFGDCIGLGDYIVTSSIIYILSYRGLQVTAITNMTCIWFGGNLLFLLGPSSPK